MFAPVFTIVLYAVLAALRGEALDVETTFTTTAVLSMITHPANMVMTMVPRAVVSYASFERVQEFLLDDGPGRSADTDKISRYGVITELHHPVAVHLEDVAITVAKETRPILQGINLVLCHGTLLICTGPVGSGKTTLARAILGELSPSQGRIQLFPKRVAYCAQTPWLPNQSIREVICGIAADQEDRDEAWYQRTIQACCLDIDIEQLPHGDATLVGSKGMNLSGGQRQRVALARAVYSRCDMAILDDSLSALDGKTQSQVVENLLGPHGMMRKQQVTTLWITSATQYFDLADEIVVLADGTIRERGTWEKIRGDDPLIDEIIHPHRPVAENPVRDPERKDMVRERKDIMNGTAAQDIFRKNGDLSLYSYYFTSAGITNALAMMFCAASCAFFNTIPQYWLKLWTESSTASTALYTTVYLLLLLLAWLSTNGIMFSTILLIAPTSGITLHHRLLTTITSAPLTYFSHHDAGATLNRFSQDIQLLDKQLAPAASSLCVQAFKLLAQATVLLLASQSPRAAALALAPSLLPTAALLYALQRVYLRTSRQLRHLELESRASLASASLEAAQGAPTLRALGWSRRAWGDGGGGGGGLLPRVLDASQRPSYLLLCLQRWLAVVLDLLVAGLAVGCVWLAAVAYRASATGAQVGVALNLVLVANSTLLQLVMSWADLEISLGAVARLRAVGEETPREGGWEGQGGDVGPWCLAGDVWPSRGKIEFRGGVTASYDNNDDGDAEPGAAVVALRDIDLVVDPGQTVVVCGRTGSGKSSLLLALLRLLDPVVRGTIAVDGVDTAALPVSAVRRDAFVTVAQEAFFLPQASLRFNLDPGLGARPVVLVAALRRAGLWRHFVAGGDIGVDEGGIAAGQLLGGDDEEEILARPLSSLPVLSVGQTQLLAMARALVRRSVLCDSSSTTTSYSDSDRVGAKPVVLLDEVTSSLDPVTENKIYDIIREEFVHNGHTVVMVTHKLDAVRGMLREGKDVVVRMAEGRIESVEVVSAGNNSVPQ